VTASRAAGGFTMVELIAVVVLLSILGVVAMGRMVSPDMYAPTVVSQALVAEVRLAQQIATSRQDAVVSLTMDRVGDDWRLRVVSDVDGVLRSEQLTAANTAVNAASGAAASMVGPGSPLSVSFDHAGNLAAVIIGSGTGSAAAGVAVTVSGDTSREICIYPSGYANQSACS
jgi:MSHA pilin protein MshC